MSDRKIMKFESWANLFQNTVSTTCTTPLLAKISGFTTNALPSDDSIVAALGSKVSLSPPTEVT